MSARSRFSAALAVFAAVATLGLPSFALAVERTVSVEAKATIRVPNDSAAIGLGVTLERGGRGAALRAVSAKLQRVIGAVQKIPGVGPGDVETGRVSVRKTDRGFRASEGTSVTLHEPARAGNLVQAAIGAGATGVRGPSYFVGDTEAAYAKALAAAFQKAEAKATTLAAQAGATLGQALTITEGGNPEIVPMEAGSVEAGPEKGTSGPPPPTKPGASTVTATVGVVFELRQ
jgi:hypothetical protein